MHAFLPVRRDHRGRSGIGCVEAGSAAVVADLTRRFGVPTAVCVNKCDINPEMAERIRRRCVEIGVEPLGEIRYDADVTRAQVEGKSVVEYSRGMAAEDIRRLWSAVSERLRAIE